MVRRCASQEPKNKDLAGLDLPSRFDELFPHRDYRSSVWRAGDKAALKCLYPTNRLIRAHVMRRDSCRDNRTFLVFVKALRQDRQSRGGSRGPVSPGNQLTERFLGLASRIRIDIDCIERKYDVTQS